VINKKEAEERQKRENKKWLCGRVVRSIGDLDNLSHLVLLLMQLPISARLNRLVAM
jgi:hypothetical protein